jgi:hypothetical protein
MTIKGDEKMTIDNKLKTDNSTDFHKKYDNRTIEKKIDDYIMNNPKKSKLIALGINLTVKAVAATLAYGVGYVVGHVLEATPVNDFFPGHIDDTLGLVLATYYFCTSHVKYQKQSLYKKINSCIYNRDLSRAMVKAFNETFKDFKPYIRHIENTNSKDTN